LAGWLERTGLAGWLERTGLAGWMGGLGWLAGRTGLAGWMGGLGWLAGWRGLGWLAGWRGLGWLAGWEDWAGWLAGWEDWAGWLDGAGWLAGAVVLATKCLSYYRLSLPYIYTDCPLSQTVTPIYAHCHSHTYIHTVLPYRLSSHKYIKSLIQTALPHMHTVLSYRLSHLEQISANTTPLPKPGARLWIGVLQRTN
jgi:hypothetical protein